VNYPALLGLTASLRTGLPVSMTRFAGTESVPTGSAVSAGVDESDIVIQVRFGHRGGFYRKFYCKPLFWMSMPPDGYTTVTISDSLATKLTRIMVRHDRFSVAGAIRYAADTTLVQEDEITVLELIQLLAERADEVDEISLQ
jgi:hypothetical protein